MDRTTILLLFLIATTVITSAFIQLQHMYLMNQGEEDHKAIMVLERLTDDIRDNITTHSPLASSSR
jgi:hypothetical protein